jgi:hypothetical protein
LHLAGLVADAAGGRVVRVAGSGGDGLGRRLADEALSLGAGDLL